MKSLSLLLAKLAISAIVASVPSVGDTPPDGYAYEFERVGDELVYVKTIPIEEVMPPTLEEGNAFCDSCGEQYPESELTELDYGEHHGAICGICRDYWNA